MRRIAFVFAIAFFSWSRGVATSPPPKKKGKDRRTAGD